MFEKFDYRNKSLIYQGLVALVKSNSGEGFHNADQGHPAYRVGKDGIIDYPAWGDSPEHNRLFQMMHELSVSLNEAEEQAPTITEYVFS